jgi:[calcium/calmodulin-dependent protein kinase] kinase
MQRLYRGKLARTHVAAAKEREVMMSGKVNVKMNKDEEVTQLNDYKIGKILGQGAYGIVYKAHGPEHGEVAVKVLNRSVLSKKTQGTGTALDGVLKEIGVMKKLRHPNCVQLWEVINDPDHNNMYLIMEFVAGGDLSAPITRKEEISEPRMRIWMRDSVLGLEYLHSFSILHRDIKPENILWDEQLQVAKLADFGVSDIQSGGSHKDYVKATAGTPAFFAPEMCGDDKTGSKLYSGRAADLWALGVCLHMWIFLRLPFEAPTVYMLMQEIGHSPLDIPENDTHSAELIELCRGLLNKKPQLRMRIKDLRRNAWMTEGGTVPLPAREGAGHSVAVKGELQDILTRGMVQLRGMKILDSTAQEGSEGNRFVDNNKQVDVAPKAKGPAGRPAPRGPGMLKR